MMLHLVLMIPECAHQFFILTFTLLASITAAHIPATTAF